MKKTLAFGIALMASASIASAQLTLPLTETFNSGGADHSWLDYNGAYSAVEAFAPTAPSGDGYVMNVNDGSGHGTIFLTSDDGNLTDYKVTAYIYIPVNTTAWSRVGIQVRCQANNNFNVDGLYFIADTDGDDYLRVSRRDSGAYSEVERFLSNPYTRDAWHKFEVEVVGDSLTAWLDDVQVYSDATVASAFPSGYVGLYNYTTGSIPGDGSPTYVDRVTIEAATADVNDWMMY